MRTRNLLFAVLFTLSTFALKANNNDPSGKNLELRSEVAAYLKGANFKVDKVQAVTINFLVNDNSEVVVISTSSDQVEDLVRNSLNYKKIKTSDYEVNKIYTLPVKITK